MVSMIPSLSNILRDWFKTEPKLKKFIVMSTPPDMDFLHFIYCTSPISSVLGDLPEPIIGRIYPDYVYLGYRKIYHSSDPEFFNKLKAALIKHQILIHK